MEVEPYSADLGYKPVVQKESPGKDEMLVSMRANLELDLALQGLACTVVHRPEAELSGIFEVAYFMTTCSH